MNCSLPGSSDHGILQARILEWVAISSSSTSSHPRSPTHLLCLLHRQVGSLPLAPPGESPYPPSILTTHNMVSWYFWWASHCFSSFSSYTLPSTSPSIWLAWTPSITVFEKKCIIFSNKSLCSTRKKKGGWGGGLSRRLSTHHCPWQLPPWTGRVWGGGHFNTSSFGPEIFKHYLPFRHPTWGNGMKIKKLSISILLESFTVRKYSQNPWVLRKGTNLSYHYYSLIIEIINKFGLKYNEWVRAQTWVEFQLQCSQAGSTDSANFFICKMGTIAPPTFYSYCKV